MKKYILENIDCAVCASKIEDALNNLDSVRSAVINPATSMLYVDTDDIKKVQKAIHDVEPKAILREAAKNNITDTQKTAFKRELLIIVAVLILFGAGMLSSHLLKDSQLSWIEYILFITAYLISGYGVLSKAVKNVFRGKIFDENFLMTVATLGAIIIDELPEAVAVMFFYYVGEFIQNLALGRSRRSIKSLLEIRPDYASLILGDKLVKISPEDIRIGDSIIIKPGEKIPLDGRIFNGNSYIDTFPLTGEPTPKGVKPGDDVMAGMINKTGVLSVKVTKKFSESSISKILELVENAGQKKAQTEKFITTFARYYTPVVVAIAMMIALIPPIIFQAENFSDWVYRALVLLVISCPCALVISIPLGYFGGIGGASRKGILIKGSNFLDVLTRVKTVVFDKTGTLTKGVFKVTSIIAKNGFTEKDLLFYAASAEYHSNHPIAAAVIEAYGENISGIEINGYEEISGRGIKATIGDKKIIAGNDSLLHEENIDHDLCETDGTVIHIAVNKKYAGYIIISDELKTDSETAILSLKKLGVEKSIILTGDNEVPTKELADRLGIETFYTGLLPEDKVVHLEKIMNQNIGSKVAFVGDGINDAPVLARADVGIAMGGIGTDAAIEAADIVIMEDQPSKVADAIEIAQKTRSVVWQNIFLALGIKGFFIVLGSLGVASMWEAVFADMGVAILAILNAARMLKS